MKKLTIMAALLAVLISCSEDLNETPNNLLVGTWENSYNLEDDDLTTSLIYNFHPDNSFDLSRVVVNSSTSEILGYRYKSTGSYQVNGNQLTTIETESYIHNDLTGLYTDEDDLELSDYTKQMKVIFTISDQPNILTFEYEPCGPLENCIGEQRFKRLE